MPPASTKVIVNEFMSLDGVAQGHRGPQWTALPSGTAAATKPRAPPPSAAKEKPRNELLLDF
jgi:hypothetical protein